MRRKYADNEPRFLPNLPKGGCWHTPKRSGSAESFRVSIATFGRGRNRRESQIVSRKAEFFAALDTTGVFEVERITAKTLKINHSLFSRLFASHRRRFTG